MACGAALVAVLVIASVEVGRPIRRALESRERERIGSVPVKAPLASECDVSGNGESSREPVGEVAQSEPQEVEHDQEQSSGRVELLRNDSFASLAASKSRASVMQTEWKAGNTRVTLSDEGTLTVTAIGDGVMTEPKDDSDTGKEIRAWREVWIRPLILAIDIQEGVTSIIGKIFSGCGNVATANVAGSVESVSMNAFLDCLKLLNVEIKEGVQEIGVAAFQRCERLCYVELPDSLIRIGPSGFSECENLIMFCVSSNVTHIDDHCFKDCRRLKNITIPMSVVSLDTNAFLSCTSLTTVIVLSKSIEIHNSAFNGCTSLTDFVYCGAKSIQEMAFENVATLEHVKVTPWYEGDTFGSKSVSRSCLTECGLHSNCFYTIGVGVSGHTHAIWQFGMLTDFYLLD